MKKEQKIHIVDELVGIFGTSGVYLMNFKGLNVSEITALRHNLREADASMKVVKNTLAKRALEQAGIQHFDTYFIGQTGVVWSEKDSVTPARVLLEFIKKYNKGIIKAGLVEGTVFDENQIETLSKLPTKQQLYAKLASTLNAPIVKLAQALNAVPEKFVRTVDALKVVKGSDN